MLISNYRISDVLLEEHADTVTAQFLAILNEQTLIDALFGVLLLAFALSCKGSDKKSIGRSRDVDITMVLDELEGFLISAHRNLRELRQRGCQFWNSFFLLVVGAGSFGWRGNRFFGFGVKNFNGGFLRLSLFLALERHWRGFGWRRYILWNPAKSLIELKK